MATATAYDAITLDVMLPDTDGFTLCRDFRRAWRHHAGTHDHRARHDP